MGEIFTIDDDTKALVQQVFDDILVASDEGGLGTRCTLLFPPRMQSCVNCVADPIGKKSSNRYLNGGPIPFADGTICPLCNGNGYEAIEVSKDIVVKIETEPSKWFVRMPSNIQVPSGMIQTKGFVSDLPFVLQARKMTTGPGVYYTLDSQPVMPGNVIQGRYFVANWKRVG